MRTASAKPTDDPTVKSDITAILKNILSYISKHDLLFAVTVALCYIVIGVGLGWYNNKVVLANPAPIAHYIGEPGNRLSFMSNWDGPNYLYIASKGYTSVAITNFFPLYPLLIRLFHSVISSWLISGLLIAWISTMAALYYYIKIVRELFKVDSADRLLQALLLFILFPTGIFLIATYTESLFAALALGSVYYALRRKWIYSAVLLAFCTATHITGLFVLVMIALLLWEQGVSIGKIAASALIGSLGLLSFMYYLQSTYRQPLAFITQQKRHGWMVSNGYSSFFNSIDFFNVIFICLLIAAIFYWWKRHKSLSAYSFLFLLIPTVGKQFGGFNRYVLMAFPIPLMIYGWTTSRKAVFYTVAITFFTISWSYFLFQYAGGYVGG